MGMTIEQYREDVKAKQAKREELEEAIKGHERTLAQLRQDYKDALVAGEDAKADKIFPKLGEIEQQIKSDRHKLVTLQQLHEEATIQSARETYKHVDTITEEYQKRARTLQDEADRLWAAYQAVVKQGPLLNAEYRAAVSQYEQLYEKYGFQSDPELREIHHKGLSGVGVKRKDVGGKR